MGKTAPVATAITPTSNAATERVDVTPKDTPPSAPTPSTSAQSVTPVLESS